jgi:hypothetical protein
MFIELLSSLRPDDTNLILHVLFFSSQSLPWFLPPQTQSWQDFSTLCLLWYYIDIPSYSVKRSTIRKTNTVIIGEDIGKRDFYTQLGAVQISPDTVETSMEAHHKK